MLPGSAEAPRAGPSSRHHLGWSLLGRAGVEWGSGIVLDLELDLLRRLVTARSPNQLEREIDARGDARRGRELAVDHVPIVRYPDAEARERLARQPVGRCPSTSEHSCLRQEQRARAHRADPIRRPRAASDVVHHDRVAHEGKLAGTAWHEQHVERRCIGERGGRSDLDLAFGLYRSGAGPDQVHTGVRDPGQHLPGADEIQRSEPWID